MEKNEGNRLAQKREIQLEEPVDWSVESYKDELTSDEDNAEEPVAGWIFKRKQRRLPMEKLGQQIIKDLIKILKIMYQTSNPKDIKTQWSYSLKKYLKTSRHRLYLASLTTQGYLIQVIPDLVAKYTHKIYCIPIL